MKTIRTGLAAAALLMFATPATAQFGGLGRLMGGDGSSQGVSGDEANQFLTGATKSTKNVMIAAAILAQAVTNAKDLTSRKSYIDAVTKLQEPKEFEAHRSAFASDLDVISQQEDLAGTISAAMEVSPEKHRQQIAIAVINIAIGIARNVELATKAPNVIRAVGRNPMLLLRIGQFKTAASLVGLQAKGLSGLTTSMPKLLAATKVRAPANPLATEPSRVDL